MSQRDPVTCEFCGETCANSWKYRAHKRHKHPDWRNGTPAAAPPAPAPEPARPPAKPRLAFCPCCGAYLAGIAEALGREAEG
jgi:hypothetical protein